MKQMKLSNNLGRDTHTRDFAANQFQRQNYQATQMLIGEILLPEPEPIYNQNMVTVKLARGGRITSVAYPGAFIDPITGNLHGSYEGPIPGQMVMVGFENGNQAAPFVVNRYPYQGTGNTLLEGKYKMPLTLKGFHSFDVMMGHFSGSYLSFNTGILPSVALPGSVTLNAITDCDINANLNVTLSGTFINLNGNTNFAVKYNELKIAFDQLKSDFNSFLTHAHSGVTTGGGVSGPPTPPAIPSVADMSAAQNLTVLM